MSVTTYSNKWLLCTFSETTCKMSDQIMLSTTTPQSKISKKIM